MDCWIVVSFGRLARVFDAACLQANGGKHNMETTFDIRLLFLFFSRDLLDDRSSSVACVTDSCVCVCVS